MKRVLIISYYWPPSAGSGVQRWLKFVKYLPKFNWIPIVYTPENPDFHVKDESLLSDIPEEAIILKQPIWEPYSLHRVIFGGDDKKDGNAGIVNSSSKGLKSYFSNWIRGNLFIPDPKKYWVKPSIKYLRSYLKDNPVDLIISTGTPHSMHLIAWQLKKEFSLPWIADFRDPMSKLDMLDSYHITNSNYRKYQKIERSIIEAADIVLTTSGVWKEDFKALGAKRAEFITNGFDESDFSTQNEPYDQFVISHFGLLNHLRNPVILWQALSELCIEEIEFKDDLRIHLGGSIDKMNIEEIKTYPHLGSSLRLFDYLTHKEVISEYQKSTVLLLLLFNSQSGQGNIPGKLFEYLAARKAILAFGPGEGDSKRIIEETNSGTFYFYSKSSKDKIKEKVKSLYMDFKSGVKTDIPAVYKYSREYLTKNLVKLMDDLTS